MQTILVVEDNAQLLQSLQRGLSESGYAVITAANLKAAYQSLEQESPDAILLDLMLPDGDGMSLLRSLREQPGSLPVMLLTARDRVSDRVSGLDAGADDYLVKPFSFDELLARIRVMLRRTNHQANQVLRVDDLEVDRFSQVATRAGRIVELTRRQFELLSYLMQSPGQVITRDMIAENVWRDTATTWTNVIDVHINQLRKRLAVAGSKPILHTVRGVGYFVGSER